MALKTKQTTWTKQPLTLSFVGQTKQHQSQKGETLACSHPHKNIWNKNILNNQANPTHHQILQPKHEVTKHIRHFHLLAKKKDKIQQYMWWKKE
jgi:hypothetical protein